LEILNKTVWTEFEKLKSLDIEIIKTKLEKMKETELGQKQNKQYDLIKALVLSIIQTNSVSLTSLKSKKIAEFVPPNGNYKDDVCIMSKYNIKKLESSGRGAFGKVYKFKNGKQTLAVKVVDISAANENSKFKCWDGWMKFYSIENMEKEAAISRHLGELGIGPKIHDIYYCVNKDKIKYYYVMDYMNRGSLISYMEKKNIKVLPQKHIDKIIAKLEKMHAAGYIHDDLHIGNILVNQPRKGELEFYISDFGLSNKISAKLDNESQDLFNELKYDGNRYKQSLAVQTDYITKLLLNTYMVPEM
jgi:serine/threonine protein kinase